MNTYPAVSSDCGIKQGRILLTGAFAVRCGALLLLIALVVVTSPALFSQGSPKVTGVDPATGKVNDNVTVSGANLTKDAVAGVFLSDDKSDYKAVIVEQSADKIVMKVPQVKPGSYNISIQVGSGILIEPVRMTVQ